MPVDSTLYEILQVSPNASDAQIKKSYRQLAKQYHPDKNSSPENEEKFKEVTFAYETLTNPEKKAMYDRFGLDAVKETSSSSHGAGFDDMFGHIFGGGGGGHGAMFEEMFSPFGGARRPRKGKDVMHPLKVTLEDLYKGKTSKIQLNKTVICSKCNGQGGKSGACYTCQECRGRGIVIKMRQLAPGMVQQMQAECSNCSGQGTTMAEKDKCKGCSGRKVVKETKILQVPVDKGMRHEQRIKFAGEGDQTPGIEPGDVVIVIVELPHEHFQRKGDNLVYNMSISLAQALCGFEKPIKHLDGRDIVLTGKPGNVIKPESLYVVTEQGMPRHRDPYSCGDLYVICDIQFPDKLTNVEELEKLLPKRPLDTLDSELGEDGSEVDSEEVDLMDYNPESERGSGTGRGDFMGAGGNAYDSDSDDEGGGPRVQQCTTG